MKDAEYQEYEASLNAYRDIKNSVDWAEKKVIIKVATKLLEMEMDNEKIHEVAGLSIPEIEELRKKLKK